ncbi:MAG: hypothetical protein AAGC57_00715 [Pseudomonadota bacterium]
MRRWALLAVLALSACGSPSEDAVPEAGTTPPPTASDAQAEAARPVPGAETLPLPGAAPQPPAGAAAPQSDAPEIYMALQRDNADVVSVIFAIDEARNNTPSDDPAIRLTPEAGLCNPQQLRRFEFPALYAARPIYSRLEAEAPVAADELPSFIATIVSNEMVRQGMARTADDTRPQNMCSYLLWQRLVYADLQSQLAGQ